MNGKNFAVVSGWNRIPDATGTYGLAVYDFDNESGEMKLLYRLYEDTMFNVSYFDRNRNLLYVLNEVDKHPDYKAGGGGRIFVFRVDKETGELTEIQRRETCGSCPAYLTLDKSGRYMPVAHHGGRGAITKAQKDENGEYHTVVEYDQVNVALFKINDDGTVGPLVDVFDHEGDGPVPGRQLHARPHCTVMSPSGKFFGVCDKGNDTVRLYSIDAENNKLLLPGNIYKEKPGNLPRYSVFHPTKPYFYHNSEFSTLISAFSYDDNGFLTKIGDYDGLNGDTDLPEKDIQSQGMLISEDGKYIYDIIRGYNLVSVMEVLDDGSLKTVQTKKIPGEWPRGCTLSPNGKFLLVTALTSGIIYEYPVLENGLLGDIVREIEAPYAAYVTFCN